MYVDRMLFPIEALGPGNRLVLWVKGCSKRCKGCANPELWEIGNAKSIPPQSLCQMILNIHRQTPIDGITVTGGDPLEQAEEVLALLEGVKPEISDILVYTGACLEQLDPLLRARLEKTVSVLIDGPYIEALNQKDCVLRGSTNQRIFYFEEERAAAYEEYLQQGRKIQNVMMNDKLISVGIHNKKGEDENEKEQHT